MRKGIVCSLLLALNCASTLFAQAFQNLDFENANLDLIPAGQYGDLVPITNALPNWVGYLGTNQVTQVLQNNLTLGAASIDIFGPEWGGIFQGQYDVVLQSGFISQNFTDIAVNAAIAQVGLIPANAKSILLEVSGVNFAVSFAGQTIPLTAVGSGPSYTLFGGNISAFAGQVGELKISSAFLPGQPFGAGGRFDAISFSPQAIPEPSTFLLTGIGAALLLALAEIWKGGCQLFTVISKLCIRLVGADVSEPRF